MIHVKKISKSNISNVDFDNLKFGSCYSDHMLLCEFYNNKWQIPKITPFDKIDFFPNSLVFHYGQAVFEGMKAYKDKNNNIFLFRPYENYKRMNISAKRLSMPSIPEDIFIYGIKKLITLDSEWVPPNYGESLYIRPFMIANGDILQASPSDKYLFIVITTPANNYYNNPLKVKIEEKYSRSCPGGIGFTKAASNYAISFFPTELAKKDGYDQIIWTDSISHSYIEESGTMNIFFHFFDGRLITPVLNDTILSGITRKSIIELAQTRNIKIEEKKIYINELIENIKKNNIKEIFGCGTAVVTNYFKFLGYKNQKYVLPKIPKHERISLKLKKYLLNIQHNISSDHNKWLFKI